jgi:hypothetical protein
MASNLFGISLAHSDVGYRQSPATPTGRMDGLPVVFEGFIHVVAAKPFQ